MPRRVLRQCLLLALYLLFQHSPVSKTSSSLPVPGGWFGSIVSSDGQSVPDGVTSSQADPLGNGPVLLLGFRKLLLGSEGLVALYERLLLVISPLLSDVSWLVHPSVHPSARFEDRCVDTRHRPAVPIACSGPRRTGRKSSIFKCRCRRNERTDSISSDRANVLHTYRHFDCCDDSQVMSRCLFGLQGGFVKPRIFAPKEFRVRWSRFPTLSKRA
jgi:hypothetical protein